MSKRKSDKRGWPERLVDEEGRPTHPLWHEYPDGKDKPCKALQIIRESERLALEAWPWRYSIPYPKWPVEHLSKLFGKIVPPHDFPETLYSLIAKGEFSKSHDCPVCLEGIPQKTIRELCVGRRNARRRLQKPWETVDVPQQIESCLDWLRQNESGRINLDDMIPDPIIARPLAAFACLHPDLLLDKKGNVRACNVYWPQPYRPLLAVSPVSEESLGYLSRDTPVGTFMDRVAELTQVGEVYRTLLSVCDIHIPMKQREILRRAQTRLDALKRTRKKTTKPKPEPKPIPEPAQSEPPGRTLGEYAADFRRVAKDLDAWRASWASSESFSSYLRMALGKVGKMAFSLLEDYPDGPWRGLANHAVAFKETDRRMDATARTFWTVLVFPWIVGKCRHRLSEQAGRRNFPVVKEVKSKDAKRVRVLADGAANKSLDELRIFASDHAEAARLLASMIAAEGESQNVPSDRRAGEAPQEQHPYNPRGDILALCRFLHWMSSHLQYGSPEEVSSEFESVCHCTRWVDKIKNWLVFHKSSDYAEQEFCARIEEVRSAIKGLQPATKKVVPPPPDRQMFEQTLMDTVRYLNDLADFLPEGPTDNQTLSAKKQERQERTSDLPAKRSKVRTEPQENPSPRRSKEPPKYYFDTYRLVIVKGCSQQEAAEVLTKERTKPVSQQQVSRELKRVKHWIAQGNVLPDIESSEKPKEETWSNERLDVGKRQDGRPETRRKRHTEDFHQE